MKALLLAVVLVPIAVAAGAQEAGEAAPAAPLVRAAYRHTFGGSGYSGNRASLSLGDRWRAQVSYSDSISAGSTDTTRTLGARLGFQGESLSANVSASITPVVSDYRARGGGVDAAWAFAGDGDEAAFEEAEIGLGWTYTRHQQETPSRLGVAFPPLVTQQNDYFVHSSLTAWRTTVSGDYFRSYYDRNVRAVARVARNRPPLAGLSDLFESFPRSGGSVRLDGEWWKSVTPFVAWSVIDYIVPLPESQTWGAGVTGRWGRWSAEASYERVVQSGQAGSNYVTLGGGARF
ncbi:MAG: hypothetical protein HYZ74_05330 [Elusimicrobia bacterium]|nr:hypothetical protein [Elusimicrobiota bacterium]